MNDDRHGEMLILRIIRTAEILAAALNKGDSVSVAEHNLSEIDSHFSVAEADVKKHRTEES